MNIGRIKNQVLAGRYFPLTVLVAFYLFVSSVTRAVLFANSLPDLESPVATFMAVMPIGVFYDAVTCLYLFIPFALYLLLLPDRIYRTRAHHWFLLVTMFAALYGLSYLGPVEYFFYDEFNARFNFVAVSYLLYPHEVFVNIWESYPVAKVLFAVLVVTLAVFWRLRHPLIENLQTGHGFRERLSPFALFAFGVALAYTGVDVTTGKYSENRVANELAQNGIYSFFYALFHNELDFNQYYLTLDEEEARARLRKLVYQPNASFIPHAANPIARHISAQGAAKRLNVVVLVQESLGADFVGAYGDRRGLTPHLDRLAKDSLMFTNVYATGTRTARGLEAISASFPPIPGKAILKRGHNEDVFTWAKVMLEQGYSPTFIYGGYSSFDAMNGFFGRNGFKVTDRTDIENPKFANIWGVSDEDLFRHAIAVFDNQYARGEKIFSLVMSTSNHKPFTFPEGIEGIPATGGGREAGVKYADYAIGRFFEQIRNKPYFSDTLFVIVGDHGARVYGKENIPMRSYELPWMIYAPKHINSSKVGVLASQLDIAPTVLGLMNFSYDSVFFGRDVFSDPPRNRFALLSHNRDIALYESGKLVELGIKKKCWTYRYDKAKNSQSAAVNDDEMMKDTISIFQVAYNLYTRGLYRLDSQTVGKGDGRHKRAGRLPRTKSSS